MNRPCPSPPTNCNPCADGNPFANLTAEGPDLNLFLSVNFRRLPNPPQNNWSTTICAAYCESAISQADADDCASRMTFDCIVDRPPPNPNRTSWPTSYCNQEMTCQNGADCYTIPAGSICDFSQIEANALAQSFCEDRVFDPSLTSPCPVVFPPALVVEEMTCEQETGTATPISLEIASMQSWEAAAVSKETLQPLVSSDPMCTTGLTYFEPPERDHPPGIYGLTWVSGYYRYTGPSTCADDPGFPYSAEVHVYRLVDEEHDYDNPTECNNQGLANAFSTLPPGSGGNDGTGGGAVCHANEAAAVASFEARFLTRAFMAHPYPPDDTVFNYSHTNTQGGFRLYFDNNAIDVPHPFLVFVGTMNFRVVQFEGLIPQPRKLAIANYSSLNFADDAAAAAWDGTFPERTVYNNMSVQWAVTAAGTFGGAVLKYTMAHPTSANGRGWQLDIFSPGLILMWRGFKAVGATSIGRYYKHDPSTPSGPPCLTCVDDSDVQWFP